MAFRFLIITLLLLSNSLFAQFEAGRNIGIEYRQKLGFLLPHRTVMNHLIQGHAHAGELTLLLQTTGKKEWEGSFKLPRYGITGYFSDFGYNEVLGKACGAYLFTELPLIRKNNWSFNKKIGFGLAYVTRIFDQEENPKNNSVSTHLNSLVVIGFQLNKQFDLNTLSLGLDMVHISNGATKMPNLGLNVPYMSFGYTRYLKPMEYANTKDNEMHPYLKARKKWQFNVIGIGSAKQIYPTGGDTHLVTALGLYAAKKIKRKVAFDFGFDFMLNQSHKERIKTDFNQLDMLQIGIYSGYVLPVNKISFLLGFGAYLKNNFNIDGSVYNRFGCRYQFHDRWSANITIKAHWGKADYFEYGLMYRLF